MRLRVFANLMSRYMFVGTLLTSLVLPAAFAQTGPSYLNISGGLFEPNGTPVESSSVGFQLQLLDPSGTCVLYSEEHLGQDLSQTKGAFSFQLGTGSSQVNNLESSTSFDGKLFLNNGATGAFTGCAAGVTLSAGATRLIRVFYSVQAGTFVAMTPDVAVTSAPYAMIADTLQGKTPANFVLTNLNSSLTQANVENVFSTTNYPLLLALLGGSSNQYVMAGANGAADLPSVSGSPATPTAGQMWYDASSNVVKFYNGSSVQTLGTASGGIISLTAGNGLTGGTITTAGSIAVDVGTTANKIVQLNASAQLPAVDGSLLTNLNSTKLSGRSVASTAPAGGQVLSWNVANNDWEPANNGGITALTGDVTATGPGSASATIANNAVTSAKVNNSNMGVNQLLITDATTGGSITYAICTANQVLQWTGTGWACTNVTTMLGTSGVTAGTYGNSIQVPALTVDATGRVTSLSNVNIAFPVSSVNGKTGVVTLNGADLGLGTASTLNYGTAATDLVQLNGSAQLPAVDGSLLTNVNATQLQSRKIASTAPNPGQVLAWNNSDSMWEPMSTSGGSVTSVAAGTGLTGGPITTTGSLSVDVGTTANKILQLNASAQIPAVDGSLLTNINSSKLATRTVSSNAPAGGQVLAWNTTNNDWEPTTGSAGSVTTVTAGTGLTGGPITTSGTLSVNVGTGASQIVQLNGTAQLPAVDGSLLTNVNAMKLATRAVSANAPGGGQVLAWNLTNSDWEPTTATTGSVTSVSAGTGLTGGPITTSGSLSVNVGTGANQIVQLNGSAQLPAVDGSQLTNLNVTALQGKAVSATAPSTNGQVLTWNSSDSKWEPQSTAFGGGFVNGGNTFGANSTLGNKDSYALSFLTNNSPRMTITGAGNVGVGTTSPAGTFDVEGGTAAANNDGTSISIVAQNAGSGGNNNGGNILLMPGTKTGSGTPGAVGIGVAPPAWLGQGGLNVQGSEATGGGLWVGGNLGAVC